MIKIISDSTCDLSQEVLERYDIDIIPLHIVKGDEELEDGPQIDIHALYEWADKKDDTVPYNKSCRSGHSPSCPALLRVICFSCV